MKLIETRDKRSILKQFDVLIKEQIPKNQQALLSEFIQHFMGTAYTQEFLGRRLNDVFGYFVSLSKFYGESVSNEPRVSIANPGLEVDGWQSPHTVIMIAMRNIPFVVDSLRIALADQNLRVQGIQHAILFSERDSKGALKGLLKSSDAKANETADALLCIEIDRISSKEQISKLKAHVLDVLKEVCEAVEDYQRMLDQTTAIAADWRKNGHATADKETLDESLDFMHWLANNSFTFLGYVEYNIEGTGAKKAMVRDDSSALGVLKRAYKSDARVVLNDVPKHTREHILEPTVFLFAKSSRRSRVHRPAYADYIVIKKFDKKGAVIGERRFLGLYTARVFNDDLNKVPLLRQKVAKARELSGYDIRDHSGKEFEQLMSAFPRDELFQVSEERLFNAISEALYAQERRKVATYLREDAFGRFVCALVYVPRDIFNTDLRLKVQNLLVEEMDAEDIDFNTLLSESPLARTQFNIKLKDKVPSQAKLEQIAQKVQGVVVSWHDDLEIVLTEQYGEEQGSKLIKHYRQGFNASYRETFTPRRAALDITHIDDIVKGSELEMSFYRDMGEGEDTFHCKLFVRDDAVTLSAVLPIYENMGFRVIGENPFVVKSLSGEKVWVHDFTLKSHNDKPVDLGKIKDKFEDLFKEIWIGHAENDRFNRLLVSSYLDWRSIAVLRSYARYMRQVRVSNSQELISQTLVNHGELVEKLLALFETRFNPGSWKKTKSEKDFEALESQFSSALDEVPNLTEDKILRLFLDLIKATVRTNFFQKTKEGFKPYISFKLLPRLIPNVPLPVPMFEIFVYSPRIEGVHLRGGKVARGGLRWSDRNEDYRTEVLGLVKAQQVKNAVIVPVGAKGGFVAKQLPTGDREAFMKEGIECYKIFISGLLDVTDNLLEGKVVPPKNTVRHDDDDYYLVVAADKGTATFSDIANQISLDRCHWLGDAFASGGSQGYDHKGMGITARGAWVSVQRHFKELGTNIQEDPFTCVGVGDMSGDVFGNGMLLSNKTKLIAAFNHMHIFLDPDPDPAKSFKERERLFALPRSSWEDYDTSLISKGGGIFSRDAKSIKLSPEVKKWLKVKEDALPPTVLINEILKAQADLLWFGGIGTYVKSSDESHAECGDKANDGLRADAKELQVKVIGEGGNLGMTQKSRIEYAANGGLLNTDFIDNAAGVDCSDNEVNIKILLNGVVASGDMTEKQRNKLLHDMTDDVADHVLRHNYRQTQAISIANHESVARTEEYRRLMNSFENAGKLNRELEFLPSEEQLVERKSLGQGLTRPELSVLISYVKGDLKEALNDEEFTEDCYVAGEIFRVFPERLCKKFKDEINDHQLHGEIVATQVANDMVNHMGISFVARLQNSTGANATSIAMAYLIARDVFQLDRWWESIEALDYKIKASTQIEMMSQLMTLMRRAMRWLIRNRRSELKVLADIERFSKGINKISSELPKYLKGSVKERWSSRFDRLIEEDVPKDLASFVSGASLTYAALGVIEAHEASTGSLERVAEMYYGIGDYLDLNWFAQQVDTLAPATHWQALAREAFREDLDWQQRALTVGLLNMKAAPKDMGQRIEAWVEQHDDLVKRWQQTLTELKATDDAEYAMYSVALRGLLDLAQSTTHSS